jgi:asparagine synthase (glutamine-hydrolysing)
MNTAQAHRGPDGAGVHVAGDLGLGHRRLAVVDLSDDAAQPFWLPDRSLALVFNGEIHNYLELAEALRREGVTLRTRSDTEVALHAYARWGEACFERFNGMWAMAFWQPHEARLLLCRDRFGVKPLLYSIRGDRIAFASEAKALVRAFPEERRADLGMLRDLLAGGVPDADSATFFANIQSVAAGSLLEVRRDRVATRRYWRFVPGEEAPRADAAAELRELLTDSVRLRMRSDVPVGIALSGGLDSSTIARLVARTVDRPIHCFSIRNAKARLDESRYAQQVADDPARYVMHWIEPPGDALLDTAARLVWHHDAPMPIRGRYPQWHLMRAAAGTVKVMLDGQGADELLGGYGRFVLPWLVDRVDPRVPGSRSLAGLPCELRQLGRVTTGIHRLLPRLLLASIARGVRRRTRLARVRGPSLPAGPLTDLRYMDSFGSAQAERPWRSRLNNALWNEFRHAGLPEVLHAEDACSMAFSIESRLPFLDHRVVELCFRLPFDAKIGAGWTKKVLRQAAEPLLPAEICWRRHKLGFPADYGEIVGGARGLDDLRGVLLDRRSVERGYVDAGWLRRRLGGSATSARHWVQSNLVTAWSLLTLELWSRLFLDESGVPT